MVVRQRRELEVPASAEDQGLDAPSRPLRPDGADHAARRPVPVLHVAGSVRHTASKTALGPP